MVAEGVRESQQSLGFRIWGIWPAWLNGLTVTIKLTTLNFRINSLYSLLLDVDWTKNKRMSCQEEEMGYNCLMK